MAITAVEEVTYESWGGYDDPRLPSRVWRGKIQTTGDSSAGRISQFLRFNLADSQRLDNYFSLEEIHMRTSGGDESPLFQSRNFGAFRIGVRFVSVRLPLVGTDTGTSAENPLDTRALLPVFLGQQIFTGTAMEVVLQVDNVNGVVHDLWCGGYVWGPRSASARNGGLMRPPAGIFSN